MMKRTAIAALLAIVATS
jgi:hypothetical protein